MLDAAKKTAAPVEKKAAVVVDKYQETLQHALQTAGVLSSILAMGVVCPDPHFMAMTTTFALSVIAGYQCVWGVQPSLHTPLMSITNAISGVTAVGGLLLLGGGYVPHTFPQFLAATAVVLSATNIVGGFTITKRMLDMFKRKTDP